MVPGSVNVLLGVSLLQVELEPDAAEVLLGLIVIMIGLAIIVGGWLLMAYVFSRIGRKFGIGSFGAYCVPVYNMVLLCRCAGISGWVAAGFFAGALNAIAPELVLLSIPIVIGTGVYLWGSIAQRLGKDFWGWGFGSVLFVGIPILFLAFDSSKPVESGQPASEPESETYDARFDDEPSYDYEPIPELMTVASVRQVRFLTGEYAGRELELPDEGIVIGRDPARANLVLQAPEVSGQHVRVTVDGQGGRLVITDLGSTNGTFIQQPVGHGVDWTQVHGSYSAAAGVPCRVRLGNGVAELEIT